MRNASQNVIVVLQRCDAGQIGFVLAPDDDAGSTRSSGSLSGSDDFVVVARLSANDLIVVAEFLAGLDEAELDAAVNGMVDNRHRNYEGVVSGIEFCIGFFCGGFFLGLGFGFGFGGSSRGIGRGGVGGRGLSLGGTCGQTKDHDDRQEQSDQFFHFA